MGADLGMTTNFDLARAFPCFIAWSCHVGLSDQICRNGIKTNEQIKKLRVGIIHHSLSVLSKHLKFIFV